MGGRRRPQAPKAAAPERPAVRYPHPSEVPDWSPDTLGLLEDLTPLQRAFVEWYVSGKNAAEAYRRATGAEYSDRDSDTSRIQGYKLRVRPEVAAAIGAAMTDRNFDARMDRQWLLQVCREQIEYARANAADNPKLLGNVPKLLKIAADLGGHIVLQHEHTVADGKAGPGHLADRMDRLIAFAEGFIRGGAAGDGGDRRRGVEDLPRAEVVPEHGAAGAGVPKSGG